MNRICVNGRLLPGDQAVINAYNRGYRYGYGLFETMRMVNGKIPLAALHFERLMAGLRTLQIDFPPSFTREWLESQINELATENGASQSGRIRLSVSGGCGGLRDADEHLQYIIECWRVPAPAPRLNEKGLAIDIYPGAQKSLDDLSNLKSSSFLPYVMAARHARDHQLDDSIVLNSTGHIADTSIANIFLVKGRKLVTPALTEGCVNGVMRRHLLENAGLKKIVPNIEERAVSIEDLLAADEVFLTNAVQGPRWVSQFRDRQYQQKKTAEIYQLYLEAM